MSRPALVQPVHPQSRDPRPARDSHVIREDVAGLRAVALVMVVLYHLGSRAVPGGFAGVDIFFVVSGFLITWQLVREFERTGRISPMDYYARRARRILPAATLVLVATVAATSLLLPRTDWRNVGTNVAYAAGYVLNWRLVITSTHPHTSATDLFSPVQHYWTLAVEEQFYAVWPLVVIASVLMARRFPRAPMFWCGWVGLTGAAILSFVSPAWSPEWSSTSTYFASTARFWELLAGAAIVLVVDRLCRLPRYIAIVVSWAGLAGIVSCALFMSSDITWPSYETLLPVSGAAAVIAGGFAAGPDGPVALLGLTPVRWVAERSYSIYLWHWPVLAVAALRHGGVLSWHARLALTVLSVVPAWLAHALVETPMRYAPAFTNSRRRTAFLAAICTTAGMGAGAILLFA